MPNVVSDKTTADIQDLIRRYLRSPKQHLAVEVDSSPTGSHLEWILITSYPGYHYLGQVSKYDGTGWLDLDGDVAVLEKASASLNVGDRYLALRSGDIADLPGFVTEANASSSYTDEDAQDAIGAILVDTPTVDFTYSDGTPSITANVPDNSITFAKQQDLTASVLVGRGSAGGPGDPQEISLGTNLSMSGTTLSATGSVTVQEEGSPLTSRPAINFVGSYITATDDGANTRTNVTAGTVPISSGGTGQTTQTAAFDALAPSAASSPGDLIAYDGTDWVLHAAGTDSYVLVRDDGSASGLSWVAPGGGGAAPSTPDYIVLTPHPGLANERVLLGTVNQIIVTDNVTDVTLSTPQDLHITANFQVGGLGVGVSAVTGEITNPGGTDSERFGAGATAGDEAIAFGKGASAGNESVVIGFDTEDLGSGSVLIGHNINSNSASFNVVIGHGASVQLNGSIAIGSGASVVTVGNNGMALGTDSLAGSNELVCGAASLGNYFTDIYFGSGKEATTPQPYTIHGCGPVDDDTDGESIGLAGGRGRGNGAGGSVLVKVAPAGGAGSTLNPLETAIEVKSTRVIQIGSNYDFKLDNNRFGVVTSDALAFWGATPTSQPTALTAPDGGTVNSGDGDTDAVIENLRTRLNELESKLQSIGLLA